MQSGEKVIPEPSNRGADVPPVLQVVFLAIRGAFCTWYGILHWELEEFRS